MSSPLLFFITFSLVVTGLCRKQQGLKTIKTKYGVYDCIDFYKQPAFDNPLLKNHTIKNLVELQRRKATGFGLGNDGCPIGTVPIMRTQHPSAANNSHLPHPLRNEGPEHCDAFVHTNDLSKQFFGAGGSLTLYRPVVQQTQWSSARIKLLNLNEYIEAGWMVNPSVFKDNEAHLYTKFKTGGKECINLHCPGFVQVSGEAPLGIVPTHYSMIGKQPQRIWNISIDKDGFDGDWWLSITDKQIPVGYWPKELFTGGLAKVANRVEWGGEINNPGGTYPYPEMGNGFKAQYDPSLSASVIRATIVDAYLNVVDPGRDTHKVWECEDLYTVKDMGYVDDFFGRIMLYGGTGPEL